MRLSGVLVGVFAGLVAADGLGAILQMRAEDETNATAPVAVVPKRFIIEFESGARVAPGAGDADIRTVKTFNSDIFSGASIETDKHTLDSLAARAGIKNVWPNNRVELVVPPGGFPAPGSGAAPLYSPHIQTGVSKLHDMGMYGEGVTVGVVDTGVWYTHEALGGGFGPGFKVEGGYDLVGNGKWPSENDKQPDADPLDQQGHGTHVSGIIAGNSTRFGWIGVAPKSKLRVYKVFDQEPGTDTATLIDAFIMAYNDGVDIITASIGGAGGWSDDAWAEVASRIVEEGVVVTIAAGNFGSQGPFFASNGAAGENVLAIASVDGDEFPANGFKADFVSADGSSNHTDTYGYLPATYLFPPVVSGWEVRPVDRTDEYNGCIPYPEGTPPIPRGVIPLIIVGPCSLMTKQRNLMALGAKYILFYNDDQYALRPASTDETGSLIALMTSKAGHAMIDQVKNGGKVILNFDNPDILVGLDYTSGGRPSVFTSWGGTYDLQIKPDIAAPGGNIFSTWAGGDDFYNVISGTSMACPYVAGVAALYIGANGGRSTHGKDFAKKLAQRIRSSGNSLAWFNGTKVWNDIPAPVAQVGTGLIDAFKIMKYGTVIEADKMALNDSRYFSRYHHIQVTNNNKEPVKYNVGFQPAAGFEIGAYIPIIVDFLYEYRVKFFSTLGDPRYDFVPVVHLPSPFTLQPGETKDVTVSFDNPDKMGWNSSALPMYSGKVTVTGNNGEQLSVPYMGIATDIKKEIRPIYREGFPIASSGPIDEPIQTKSSLTFNLSLASQDFMKLATKHVWGLREMRWDIFQEDWRERDWVYPPVVGQNGYVGTAAPWADLPEFPDFFDPKRDNANNTFSFPLTQLWRSSYGEWSAFWWLGRLGDGTQIKPGKYKMRFAVLAPFGNPTHADNWDVFKVPTLEVLPLV